MPSCWASRFAVGAEHAHQAFRALVQLRAKLLETEGGVDIVAQQDFSGLEIRIHQGFQRLFG